MCNSKTLAKGYRQITENVDDLDKGRIREQGNHEQLLAQNGWYARMIAEQAKARNWSIE